MSGAKIRTPEDIDVMMTDILTALEIIKTKLPNGELVAIQDRMEGIESIQDEMKVDIKLLRKQLLDPEDGIIVRVNKNTEFRKKIEASDVNTTRLIDEHKELMSFKGTVTKVLWIVFTAIAGLLIGIVFKLSR